ncbi:type II secretion system F family protein [Halioxenophilus aromaticivorans]|uniref:Type II secretion system F family protein n=1 Tax=Halioxenophilus aromaticivorans TaxID=1306992 RepID=A0AAV3U972_9ALTE
MPKFKYTAIDATGKKVVGTMQANNLLDVEYRLDNLKLDLVTLKELSAGGQTLRGGKLSRKDIINMVFQLEQLTKSGVPLLDGLADLRDSTPAGYYHDILTSIMESIEGGKTFSDALEGFPNDFDHVFVSLIKVGEESGELTKILGDMCQTLRWTDELVAKTVKILMYPAIVGVVVMAVTTFLMIYLVPQIVPFVKDMGSTVPKHTEILIAVSNCFVAYWWVIIPTPVAIFYGLKLLSANNRNIKYKLDALKLKLPIFGSITYNLKIARFANYMALLYSSGITVINSLDIGKELVNNLKMADAIEEAKAKISDGTSISESFATVNIFPPLVIRMLRVGENTGNLDEALINVRYFYDREVQETIDKIEPTINPLLTAVMGLLLGWIMLAVLGPVWDAVASVS